MTLAFPIMFAYRLAVMVWPVLQLRGSVGGLCVFDALKLAGKEENLR